MLASKYFVVAWIQPDMVVSKILEMKSVENSLRHFLKIFQIETIENYRIVASSNARY